MTDPNSREPDPATAQLLEQLPRQFEEIGEHVATYARAQWARGKGSVRDGLLSFALWSLLVLLLTGALLIAIAFVFYGSALALTQLLGGRAWAGYLVSGGSLLLFAVLYLRWKLGGLRRAALQKKISDYEQRLERQKERFGASALERASAAD